MKKKVSLKDVANHVGVSTALVSYVLNGKEKEARVGAQMVEKIRKAVLHLKYQPNLIAKSLKSGRTNTIGLILADISNPFFSYIARIIEDEAKKQGYVVIFGSSDESDKKQEDLINVFVTRQVDAIIMSPAAGTENQVNMLRKKGVPVILIDRYFSGVEVDSVHIDNLEAAYKAVSHLIKKGRKRIAMVAYEHPMAHMNDRISGYLKAMKEAKIKVKKEWLVEIAYADVAGDMNARLSKLLNPLDIDGILFASNSLAVGGLKKILEFDIKVPDQVAIISFDETDVFDFFYSPITYISQSVEEIGKQAVLKAAAKIDGTETKTSELIIGSELIVRKSSGV